jgi:hypothetical protein
MKKFEDLEKNEINTFWREYLVQYFENVLVPKKRLTNIPNAGIFTLARP